MHIEWHDHELTETRPFNVGVPEMVWKGSLDRRVTRCVPANTTQKKFSLIKKLQTPLKAAILLVEVIRIELTTF